MRFPFKPFISLLLTAVMLTLGLSGIMQYLAPRGRVATWTGWTLLGLEKAGLAGRPHLAATSPGRQNRLA